MSMPTGFIENKRTDLHQARFHARDLAERLLVVYWAPEKDKAYHIEEAHEALRQAAEAMGYALAYLPKQDDEEAA